MSKNKNRSLNGAEKLSPDLRFPEFQKDGEWEKKSLGDVSKVVSRRNKENRKLPIYSINNKEGFLPQNEQFEGVDSSERGYDITLYKIIGKHTFAYNPARIDVGSLGYSGELSDVIISSLYVCFQTAHNVDDRFIWQFFKTFQFNYSVKKNVEGGIRNYLFYENFSKISVALPSILEQKKIASSLCSLDDLITAHIQKLELLKIHKKGLMQNLFPPEGKKVPKFRFKEFEKDEEWEVKKLNEIATFVNEKKTLKNLSIKTYISTENLLSDYAGVVRASKLPTAGNFTKYKKGDVLISNIRPYLKKVWLSDTEGACSNDVFVVRAKSEIDEAFLSFLLKNDEFINYTMIGVKGVKMPRGDKDLISKYPILFPRRKTEQQKISSCLCTIDELISAQAGEIDQLKLYKKGLMQGLFPKINDRK